MTRSLAALSLAFLLAACATPAREVPIGASADEVVQRLGRPSAEHALPGGGRRLEYGGGAFGKQTWMADLDPAGKLVAMNQVRDEAHFNVIRKGMTADEVRQRLGAPAHVWGVRYHDQTVWSYRYENTWCQWFMVGLTPGRQVEDTSYGPDPVCDRDRVFAPFSPR